MSYEIAQGVGANVMSHKNLVLNFDHNPPPLPPSSSSSLQSFSTSDIVLSPAEVPFGRRYAEISQFKNHPNIEW
jgi:hypothetical protein